MLKICFEICTRDDVGGRFPWLLHSGPAMPQIGITTRVFQGDPVPIQQAGPLRRQEAISTPRSIFRDPASPKLGGPLRFRNADFTPLLMLCGTRGFPFALSLFSPILLQLLLHQSLNLPSMRHHLGSKFQMGCITAIISPSRHASFAGILGESDLYQRWVVGTGEDVNTAISFGHGSKGSC